jgi:PhnB protein
MVRLNPYIHLNGTAREAIGFYKTVFGGELVMTTYKEGGMSQSPGDDNKIMHAQLEWDGGVTLMASDAPDRMGYQPEANGSVSLSGPYEDEGKLRGYWNKLSAGGNVEQPLVQSPWGDTFGMLTDKFGIHWMVNIAGKKV